MDISGIPPWIQGSVGLLAAGAAANYLSGSVKKVFNFVRSRMITSIEVLSTDEAFPWLMTWVGRQTKSRFMGLRTRREPGADEPETYLVPRGLTIVKFGGHRHLVWVIRESVDACMAYRESLLFQGIWLTRARFMGLVEEAKREFEAGDMTRQRLYTNASHGWVRQLSVPRRRADSVVLVEGLWDEILSDVRSFLDREQWYADNGLPWRRGYLFKGPPGNGKSSAVRAIVGEIGLPLYVLYLKSIHGDSDLIERMNGVPPRSVLAIEDIDCLVNERKSVADASGISFAGLLNAIDGIASAEGRILILTTNHAEKLDPALIRPGRTDRQWEIGNPTYEQAEEIASRILHSTPYGLEVAARIARQCVAEQQSAAWVQGEALKALGGESESRTYLASTA